MGGNKHSKFERKRYQQDTEARRQEERRFVEQLARRITQQTQRNTRDQDDAIGSGSASTNASNVTNNPLGEDVECHEPLLPKLSLPQTFSTCPVNAQVQVQSQTNTRGQLDAPGSFDSTNDESFVAKPILPSPKDANDLPHENVALPLPDLLVQSVNRDHQYTRINERNISLLVEMLVNYASKWKGIGIALGFTPSELEVIEAKPSLYVSAPSSWLTEMLNKWVQWTPETHGKYATLQDLVNALRSKIVGLGAVAEEIRTEFSGHGDYRMDQHQPESSVISSYHHSERSQCKTPKVAFELIPPGRSASAFEHYAYYLRSYFSRRRQPADKWPGIEIDEYIHSAIVRSKYLIHEDHEELRKATVHGLIDAVLESKAPVHFSDLLQPNCINGKVHALKQLLVVGAPGIGKSTMSCEVCRKWGNGELFQEYSLVVMFRFRDSWVQQIKSVSDLFCFPGKPEMQREVAKEIERTQGKGLLFILEGYDEAPPSLRSTDSFFFQLFTGLLLPNATVMVTTRPNACSELRRECKGESSRIVEILGFGEKEIEEYVQSRFNGNNLELENFRKYLELHPHIYSMMYVPLNSAIITQLYQSSKANSTIVPQTMTQLYTAILKTLLLRYMKEIPEYESIQISDFNDLPQPVLQKFLKVCELAFRGISSTEKEVIFADLPGQFDSLGLMQSVPELYISQGTTVSHNFLHLTIQEYLAAYHLSLLSEEEQLSFLEKNLEEQTTVAKFFAGLSHHNVSLVCKALKLNEHSTEETPELSVSAIHVLFELQERDALSKVLGSQAVKFSEKDKMLYSPYDYYVLGFCICCSLCSWDITVTEYSVECIEMLSKGLTKSMLQHETDQFTGPGPGVTHLDLGLVVGLTESVLGIFSDDGVPVFKQFDHSARPSPFTSLVLPLGESESDLSVKRKVGYLKLAESMHLFPNLQHLEMSKLDGIGHEGAVFKYLPKSLSSLNLNMVNYDDVQPEIQCRFVYEKYYEDLRDLLKSPSCSIEHLKIGSVLSLTPICLQHIVDGLSQNTSIKNFELKLLGPAFDTATNEPPHVQLVTVTSILFSLLKLLRENTTLTTLAIDARFSSFDRFQ